MRGKRAFIVGTADDNGYGWAIEKSFGAAGTKILVGTWVPALNIFETSLKQGKFNESRVLPNGSLMEISKSCFATLPLLYWRYTHQYSHLPEQDPLSSSVGSHPSPHSPRVSSYVVTSGPHFSQEEDANGAFRSSRSSHDAAATDTRINIFVERFKMDLDCFFAIWFVVGNVWIFGGHSSSTKDPNLYRLCIVFLTFSCIGYAMPFILCATICCCLPCIISLLGF